MSSSFANQTIIAFGHFVKNNEYTSIITRDHTLKSIYFYYWDNNQKLFIQSKDICGKDPCSLNILNVIPIDWNYDGYLDFILLSESETSNIKNRKRNDQQNFQVNVFIQDPQGQNNDQDSSQFQFKICDSFPYHYSGQPFIIPLINSQNSKNHTHGLYIQEDNQRIIMIRNSTNENCDQGNIEHERRNFNDLIDKDCQKELLNNKLAETHYSSVLDLNNDCKDDLFIHSQNEQGQDIFEFYIRLDNDKYCLTQLFTIPIDYKVSSIGFQDINFDGSIDMVIIYDKKDDKVQSLLQIAYNKNQANPKNLCKKISENKQIFGDIDKLQESSQDIILLKYEFTQAKSEYAYPQIRFGDINLDGYPDMLLTVHNNLNPKDQNTYSYLFENNFCDEEECYKSCISCQNLDHDNKRYFKWQKDDPKFSLIYSKPSFNAMFFDINENGQLDIILNTYKSGNDQDYDVTVIYNYLKTESYFVKSLILNGSGDQDQCLSSNYYGATSTFKIDTIKQGNKIAKSAYLYQSQNMALQLPFNVVGIQRSKSYVQNFNIGVDSENKQWNPIIPNSQLIVTPLTKQTKNWDIQISSNIQDSLIIIFMTSASILVILGIIIFFLHMVEKQQDKKDNDINNFLM